MKQSCQTIIAFCLSFLFCGQALAQHSGPYIGTFVGGNALMNAKASDNLGDFVLTFEKALQWSAVLGWDFEPGNPVGEGRIELEYARRSNPLDQVKLVDGDFIGGGNVTSDSLLLNFFGIYHDNSSYAPYAGGGIGATRIEMSDLQVAGYPMGSGSAVVFAYQVGAGVDIALTDHLNLDLGYRFFSSTRPTFIEISGRKFDMDYSCHSAVLGLRLGF